jgi:hypothetical protein
MIVTVKLDRCQRDMNRGLRAERLHYDVLRDAFDLLGLDRARIYEHLRVRLVFSDLLYAVAAYKVSAAVSDLRYGCLAALHEHGRDGCAHPGERGVALRLVPYTLVSDLRSYLEALRLDNVRWKIQKRLAYGLDRYFAGNLARDRSPHAIRDYKKAASLAYGVRNHIRPEADFACREVRYKKSVLIAFAAASYVGSRKNRN